MPHHQTAKWIYKRAPRNSFNFQSKSCPISLQGPAAEPQSCLAVGFTNRRRLKINRLSTTFKLDFGYRAVINVHSVMVRLGGQGFPRARDLSNNCAFAFKFGV
jgi:hypothetical protein